MKKNKTTIATIASILVLVTTMFVTLQPSSVAAQDQTSTPENWIELITQTPGGAYRETPGITEYPRKSSPAGNSAKTGYSEGPGPETNHLLWRADIPVFEWNNILADKGKIFLGSIIDHCFYCLDENTGEVIWQRNVTGGMQRWCCIAYNLVFITDASRTTALSINTGNKFWTYDEPGSPALSVAWREVFEDGEAVYLGRSNNITCLKVQYGMTPRIQVIWNRNTVRGRLSYSDHKIYGVSSYSTWCSCADAATGDLIWNFTGTGDIKDRFYPSPTIAYGNVYLGTERPRDAPEEVVVYDHVVCLDAETGAYKWTYETGEYFVESISAAYGNIYIAGGERNSVHCVDGETGEKKWEYTAPGFVDYYEIQIADNKLYFVSAGIIVTGFPVAGSFPGSTNCVDAITGEPIWSYQTPTSGTSPMIVDGKLYHQTEEDYVWCFGKGPTTTNIEVASTSLTLGQSALISGSVTDMSPFSQQHPELQSPVVAEVPIVLSYVNAGTWTDFATVNTDSAGTFMYNLTPSSIGGYTVVARFEGNDAYDWSSAQKVVSVSPAPEPEAYPEAPEYTTIELAILTAVAISIVIGAVSFYILRKRK